MYLLVAVIVERMQYHSKLARLTGGHSCEYVFLVYHVVSIFSAKVKLSREFRADAE